MLQLALDHCVSGTLDVRARPIVASHDLESIAQRGKRIAQLVREHREELALALLRVVSMLRQLAPLEGCGQIADHRIDQRDLAGREMLLRTRPEYDGAEDVIIDDECADHGAGKTEIAQRSRTSVGAPP